MPHSELWMLGRLRRYQQSPPLACGDGRRRSLGVALVGVVNWISLSLCLSIPSCIPHSNMSASPSPPPAQAGVTETQADLYNQVFGEGSDVSDISDDEEEQAVPRRRAFPPRDAEEAPAEEDEAGATQEADQEAAGDKDEDEDDDEDEDEDAYIPGSTEHAAKIPKFKKRREADQGEDEDEAGGGEGSDEERRRRKKKRKMEKAARKERERERRAGAGGDDEDEEAEPVHDEVTRELALCDPTSGRVGGPAQEDVSLYSSRLSVPSQADPCQSVDWLSRKGSITSARRPKSFGARRRATTWM